MRFTRAKRIKIYRNKKRKRTLIYLFVLPGLSILAGYLITLLLILPAIAR